MLNSLSRPRVAGFILCLAFLTTMPCALFGQAPPPWAQERLDAWLAAFNAGDAAALASLYAPEAVRLAPDAEPLRGRDAIEHAFAERFRASRFDCEADIDDIQVIGALATASGHDRCTIMPQSGGAATTSASRWLLVFHRQGEEWLIVYVTHEAIAQ